MKSIQLCNLQESHYFTVDDFKQSDDEIRRIISRDFIRFLSDCTDNVKVAFFNMTFDLSQFLKFLVTESGYTLIHEHRSRLRKGEMTILETDRKVFSVKFRSYRTGYQIEFIDLANFATGSTLNMVAWSWIHEQKIELDSKVFPKKAASDIEKEYALKDALLTYKIYMAFLQENVIEKSTYTIAGRTIKDFKHFIKSKWCTNFDLLMFGTQDTDEIESIKESFEYELRKGVKGGICQAYHKGVFENVIHIDACSMYPTQMIRDYIPFGKLESKQPNGRFTSILYPSGWYLLKQDHVPCVQWTNHANLERYHYLNDYECGEYVKDFYLDGSYPIYQEEYEIIKMQYIVIDEKINKIWYIRLRENTILKEYINMLYDGKSTNTGAKRLYYKYLLNSLYGKFLTRPDGITIDYVYENDDWYRIKVASEKQTYYLPLGNMIRVFYDSFSTLSYRFVDCYDGSGYFDESHHQHK